MKMVGGHDGSPGKVLHGGEQEGLREGRSWQIVIDRNKNAVK